MKASPVVPLSLIFTALASAAFAQNRPSFDAKGRFHFDDRPQKLTVADDQDSVATGIAAAGHGMLFGKEGKRIEPDPRTLNDLQDTMLGLIRKEHQPKLEPDDLAAAKDAEEALTAKKLTEAESIAVKSALIRLYLRDAPPKLRATYGWRDSALLTVHLRHHPHLFLRLSPWILELLKRLHLFDRFPVDTTYMADCRAHGVPIPPDWAESGTPWVLQGTLSQNLLDPGGFAAVWTYSDPGRRGACIALPRGNGGPGSPAGIICQSATTGAACFWDNILRSASFESFIGWSGQTLRIKELKDGSNLASSCTRCHRGNNVYNISPDDSTWAKVLRGPMAGPWTATFTTRVESSTDNRPGHPRYVPITTVPPRAGWDNPLPASSGCSSSCHEPPSTSFGPPPMPPACASGGCYGW